MKKSLHFSAKSLQNTGGGISQHKSASIIAGQFSHRKWYSTFILLLLLTFGVGNAWAIDWTNYAVGYTLLEDGGKYYLWNHATISATVTTDYMLSAPSSYPKSSNKTTAWSKNASTGYADATKFTFTAQSTANQWKISYTEGNNTRYLTQKAGTGGNSAPSGWNTIQEVWEIKDYTHTDSKTYYPNGTLVNTAKTSSKALYFTTSAITWRNLGINTNNTGGYNSYASLEWQFVSEAAYEDATAGTTTTAKTFDGHQYYYTANANATAGGTAVVATTTYRKPNKSDLANSDYAATISGQKGKYSGTPTVTFYYKATVNSGYHFVGWFAAEEGGDPLSTDLEYTVSNFSVTSTSSSSRTTKNLYARFEEDAAAAALYTGGTGEPTYYGTLGAALTAAANGDLIVLQGNIGEAQTINKNITLDFNGYKIQGSAATMVTVSAGNVTFVDNSIGTPGGVTTTGATAVYVNGGSLTINDGAFDAATYALQRNAGTVTINRGGFEGNTQDISGTITLNGGYFEHNAGLSVSESYAVVSDIPTGMKYSADDYNYMVVSKTSANYPVCVVISKKENTATVRLNFNTLESALAYANNNANDDRDKTILMRENYTLPAGNYTIPMYTTLVIPYSAEQTDAMPHIDRVGTKGTPTSAYRTLTLANGVHIDVRGAIEVGGVQTVGGAYDAEYSGEKATAISRPGGDTYGLMQMNSGSSITFYEDANLYAWGFVQGEGTIDMRRGAVAREQFQINDWKTISPTAGMAVGYSVDYQLHVLPINQYFIQNVEVATTYRPGSKLFGQVSAYVYGLDVAFNDVGIIGVKYSAAEKAADPDLEDDVAIFLMDNEDDSEDTWVRKSYDVEHDVQLYEVNNSAYLGSLAMDVTFPTPINVGTYGSISGLDVDSRDFALPLTNNFKIHLLTGNLYVTQDTEILPGAVIEINKHATMTINAGQTLFLYDIDQWGTYVSGEWKGDAFDWGYASVVKYRPGGLQHSRSLTPAAGLADALLDVHGTVDVKGYLKTTTGDKKVTPKTIEPNSGGFHRVTELNYETISPATDGGASIVSTIADAGTIIFSTKAQAVRDTEVNDYIWQVYFPSRDGTTAQYKGDHVIPALLTNEDGSFAHTANTAAGKSFCFIDFDGDGKGEWKRLTDDGCFVYDENDVYYAKPQAYVALANGKTANADHTYTSADGTKTLILMDDCQWWEVETVAERPDLFHCTHPQNDMYYYWDGEKWTEKRYTVTWNDWDGTEFDTYSMKYGVKPQYLGNVPQREKDAYYTYDFIGWSPEITSSTIVTADVTYTAQYERNDVMYTVTWKDEANNVIEVGYFKLGEVPTCTETVDMTNKEWTPAVAAVTGNTEYKLQPKDNVGPYDIKFVNWNGVQIGETQSVAKNSMPTLPATDPTKPALGDIEFTFAGWTPTVVAATADAVYTATFTEQPITYTILWKNDNGVVLETDNNVTPNTVPQYNGATPVRSTDGANYVFAGWTPTVVAATANAEYTATYQAKSKTVDGETYNVPASTTVTLTDLIITDDGKVSVPVGSQLNAHALTLESTGSASGELIVANNSLVYAEEAYFDYKINAKNHKWYSVAVPWQVDATSGISVNGKTLTLGKDFDIIYYDGARRASEGKQKCWKYVENDGDKTLQPGRLYMIGLMSDAATIRFTKKSGASLLTTSTSVTAYSGAAAADDQGWNGVANPALFHAYVNPGVTAGQVYNPETNSYDPILMNDAKFVVGQGAFVEVEDDKAITVSYGGAFSAPRRARAEEAPLMDVRIAPANGGYTDRLFVTVDEEKEEAGYVVGKDLAKLGVSKSVAQMWINRYDAQLCLNTVAPVNGVAEYPLSIFAPKAGEYMITINNSQFTMHNADYALYLTLNGRVIWNLSYAPYTATLEKGTTTTYGLRLILQAPQTATSLDEALIDAQGEARKVLIDNKVYIIRGNEVYTLDGRLVK